ncbi:zf-CCHC domain-containing protein/Asp_protease_2 domain-containing protein [Cucumis melo var. makuwa]|uniref:Zf-CCHC domain-containing protein/Asp_protease_2 domain-containing protein n=1 Tax=Cucumis melo var. makuwa TaxID=1194695 RepID=A0A5A7U0I8_CUCMM|nr:hypothetical protein E6C27_scaffold43G00100 [Cucumis melo var. makuwa]TYK07911.1 zf-CCHC domain-containing protein/Asp_protease_2 domain-containing protein [Cucumis melo var. makuwa]
MNTPEVKGASSSIKVEGHLSNACPKRKTVAILEEEEDFIEEQEGDFYQEEVLEPDEGERLSCVLQRVLIAPKSDTSHQQRHSLFKTRFTIKSKVCNVIIDSGSSENFVSKKLVTALKLKTEPHSSPYKKGGDAHISEICSVPLSIGGTYKDQIVCDILDMDVCHILLGKPWQYDVQAIHRGRENTYEFQWMNNKIFPMPLGKKNEGVNPKKINSHLFIVDLDQLLDDANEVKEFHATKNLPNTLVQVVENSFRQNKGFQLGNLSSESKSRGPSRIDTDAFEDNICGTILDNRNIHKFNTNENYIENGDLSDENVKGDIVANEHPSCSRKRTLR